ncbi:MAG TPA: hypothetical protein ENN60_00555 [archaeon]|nr:hypothetical protein [archaeon]
MGFTRKLVVGSATNLASQNLTRALDGRVGVELLDSDIVDLHGLEKIVSRNDLVIVASSHKSEKGTPSLTAHTPGNFGPAEMGGEPGRLAINPALYVSEAVREFARLKERRPALAGYDVCLEVTHHGPSFSQPIVFVEVGSSEKQWRDMEAIRAAADVIVHLLDANPEGEVGLGVGGTHYAPYFTKKCLEGVNFGHICPKYASDYLDKKMLEQMANQTWPKPEVVWIDWKGTPGGLRQQVRAWAGELGLKAEKC